MSPEKLFQLVFSMTKDQKSYFRRNFKGTRKTLDLLLYDRILSVSEINKNTLKKIRGKEFKEPSKFHYYRLLLSEKIIQSLVAQEGAGTSPIPFIEKAVAMDLTDLARKELEKQLLFAQEGEDFERMVYLYGFRDHLQEVYQESLPLVESIQGLDIIKSHLSDLDRLKNLYKVGKSGLKMKPTERLLVANRIKLGLVEISPESITGKRWKLKVSALDSILREDYSRAQQLQGDLIDLVKNNEGLIPSQYWYLRELVQFFKLSLALSEKLLCFKIHKEIQEFEPTNLKEIELKERELLKVSRAIADHFCSEKIALFAAQRFEDSPISFSQEERMTFYFFFASTFFHSGNWEKSLEFLAKVKEIHPKKWDSRIGWEVDAIAALVLSEKDEFEKAELYVRSLQRKLAGIEEEYPLLTYSIIRKYVYSIGGVEIEEFEKMQNELVHLLQKKNENKSAQFFNVQFWVEGKIRGCLPSDLIAEFGKDAEKAIAS